MKTNDCTGLENCADLELMTDGRISKEVWLLAKHHMKILRCKFPEFPDYNYGLFEHPKYWLRLQVTTGRYFDRCPILRVSFSSSSIKIETKPFRLKSLAKIINYADPAFTDDVLSDLLKVPMRIT